MLEQKPFQNLSLGMSYGGHLIYKPFYSHVIELILNRYLSDLAADKEGAVLLAELEMDNTLSLRKKPE